MRGYIALESARSCCRQMSDTLPRKERTRAAALAIPPKSGFVAHGMAGEGWLDTNRHTPGALREPTEVDALGNDGSLGRGETPRIPHEFR